MPWFAEFDTTVSVVVEHLSSATFLDNVEQVQITQGRSNLSDSYRSATATIEGRFPDDLPNIKIGDLLEITVELWNAGVLHDSTAFTVRVADVTNNYGTTSKLDTFSISCEDGMAILGRAALDLTVSAGTTTTAAAEAVCNAVGGVTFVSTGGTTTTTVNAQTFDNANALDVFQTYANTELAFVVQQGDTLQWTLRNGWTNQGSITTFTDDATGYPSGGYLVFQALNFSSLADTVADQVIVKVRDGGTYTAGTGNTSVTFDAFSQTAADAQGLADFIKVLFTDDEPQPYQLSYLLNGQAPDEVLYPIEPELRQVNIDFRGTLYQAVVLGFTLSVDAQAGIARANLNLLSKQQIPFLVLDDPYYGILDTNVLSW